MKWDIRVLIFIKSSNSLITVRSNLKANVMATLNFFKLPNEIKHHILSFLDYAELRRLKEARNSNDQNISKGGQYTMRSLSTHINAVIADKQNKKRVELKGIVNRWEENASANRELELLQSQLIEQAKNSAEGASIILFEEEFRKHILLEKEYTYVRPLSTPFNETIHFEIGRYIKDIALSHPWSIPQILEDEKLLKFLLVCPSAPNFSSGEEGSWYSMRFLVREQSLNDYRQHNNLAPLVLAHPNGWEVINKRVNQLMENDERCKSNNQTYVIEGWEYSVHPISSTISTAYAVSGMKHHFKIDPDEQGEDYGHKSRLFDDLKLECLNKLYPHRKNVLASSLYR
jgi:hypothetical protein